MVCVLAKKDALAFLKPKPTRLIEAKARIWNNCSRDNMKELGNSESAKEIAKLVRYIETGFYLLISEILHAKFCPVNNCLTTCGTA